MHKQLQKHCIITRCHGNQVYCLVLLLIRHCTTWLHRLCDV